MPDAYPSHGAQHSGLHPRVQKIVAEQRAPLTRYAARLLGDPHLAHDVVQDVFAKLLVQSVAAIDGHVVEWLFTVCRHRAIDLLRQQRTTETSSAVAVESLAAVEPLPGRALEAREAQAMLLRLIDLLPASQQEVVRLKFQHGFSYKQIAKITDLTVGNVGFLVHTAVNRLRAEWAKSEGVRPQAVAQAK